MTAETHVHADGRSSDWSATAFLALCMLCTGASGLVSEYVLSTVLSYILGNSIVQFSLTIAIMMLSMGIAGWLQKFISDDRLIEKFAAIEIALAIAGSWAPIALYGAYVFAEDHFQFVHYALSAAIGGLIGLEIPIVLRINARYSHTLRANIAAVLACDYIGSFLGALGWIQLLKTFSVNEISFIVSGFNFLVAFLAIGWFWYKGLIVSKIPVAAGLVVAASALTFGWFSVPDMVLNLEQRLYSSPIVHAETTPYQRVVITKDKATSDVRLYLNGALQLSSLDESRYHETLVHPAMHVGSRDRVLILGGGDGLGLKNVLMYPDVKEVTLVDLDPAMVRIASENEYLRRMNKDSFKDARVTDLSGSGVTPGTWKTVVQQDEETRRSPQGRQRNDSGKSAYVRVLNVDADRFVSAVTGSSWNVVIVDFPDPTSPEVAKLYTREFYSKLKRIVAPGGVIVVQSTSPYFAKEAFLMIGRTIESAGFSAIPMHVDVPSFGDWGFWMASPDLSGKDISTRLSTLEEISVPTSFIDASVVRAIQSFGKGALQTDRSDVNSLMRPALIDVYLSLGWLVES